MTYLNHTTINRIGEPIHRPRKSRGMGKGKEKLYLPYWSTRLAVEAQRRETRLGSTNDSVQGRSSVIWFRGWSQGNIPVLGEDMAGSFGKWLVLGIE